jgi:hypothetical protein
LSAEHLEHEHAEPEYAKPDYEHLIDDLGVTAVIQAMWQDEGGFLVTESAGASSDAVTAFRNALDILNPSQFQNDPSTEGLLDIERNNGGTIWSTIIDGHCCIIDSEGEEFMISPDLLIEALRQREAGASQDPVGTK